VLVTANYKLTVDALRRDLAGTDVWLLLLETYGVNVWCAAGKGTFSTDEVVRRVLAVSLPDHVSHERLVLPQLGAPGVSAEDVHRATGYRVTWGPVRSADLPAFLAAGMKATPEMRRVTFPLRDRAVLVPVELVAGFSKWRLLAPVAALLAAAAAAVLGPGEAADTFPALAGLALAAWLAGVLSGTVGVPLALPWLPGRAFALKGALLGAVAGLPVAVVLGDTPLAAAAAVLGSTVVASYLGMQFTGSTPFTSPSGVERELRTWIPAQAVGAVLALVLFALST